MRHTTLIAAALITFGGGSAAAQGIEDLVGHDLANRSASVTETQSIAAYVADRNKSTLVQVLSRPQPTAGLIMTLDELLAAIGAEAAERAVTATPAVTPAAVRQSQPTIVPAAAPEPRPTIVPVAAPAAAPPPTQPPCEKFRWNGCTTVVDRERGDRGRGGGGGGGGEPDKDW